MLYRILDINTAASGWVGWADSAVPSLSLHCQQPSSASSSQGQRTERRRGEVGWRTERRQGRAIATHYYASWSKNKRPRKFKKQGKINYMNSFMLLVKVKRNFFTRHPRVIFCYRRAQSCTWLQLASCSQIYWRGTNYRDRLFLSKVRTVLLLFFYIL